MSTIKKSQIILVTRMLKNRDEFLRINNQTSMFVTEK